MNKLTTAIALMGVLLAPVAFSDDTDMDHSNAKAFVKDSVITTKIKASLAADHITSVGRIKVDTDANGVVWLSGTARTQEAVDKAVQVARDTKGVKDVHSSLKVRADD